VGDSIILDCIPSEATAVKKLEDVPVLVELVLGATFVAKPESATKVKFIAEPVVHIGVHCESKRDVLAVAKSTKIIV